MTKRLILAVSALALLGASAGSFAAGGGGNDTVDCGAGKVYDKNTKKCVAQQSGVLPDDDLYDTGRMLALKGNYSEAIKVLSLAENKSDPRILNYLGYAHRKSGRILVGLGYYQEALRIDPNSVLVREYLGEAHLMLGDVASARAQLDEIAKRKGTGCAEYTALAAQIDAFVKKG